MFIGIETDRLHIRPIAVLDRHLIYLLTNTEGWLKFIGDMQIKDELDAEIYIRRILDRPNYSYNVVEWKEIGQPIGIVTFIRRPNQKHPDFGFATLPEFEGKGFSYEASKAYLAHLDTENETILGITDPANIKSIGLLTKLGFALQGSQVGEDGRALAIYERM